jgi:hypothetical protein
MRSSTALSFTKYYYCDQNKDDAKGGIRSKHGTDEKCIQNFGQKT